MSPEQVRGMPLDRRSDVFSLGIVLYELLVGERLFAGATDFATLEKVRTVDIPAPRSRNPDIPEDLESIVLRSLAVEPEDRYPTAMDLHDSIQACMVAHGLRCTRKDLAMWMRVQFVDEIAAEKQAILDTTAAPEPPEPPADPTVLDGRYRLLSRLGQGGMGTVYAAEHVGLGQRRAIKFLRADIAHKPGAIQRFLQEARALSAMRHPYLVDVLDMGEHAGSAYYVMEFLAGEDLRTRLRRLGPWSWARTRAVALQIAEALRTTHARGIVHRDLKPENCFCLRPRDGEVDPTIKVIDFGVAKIPKEMGGASQLTGTGEALGTIGYMAPEQMEGRGDHRVDVYSLGVMIFEMLAGRPLHAGNPYEIISKMLLGQEPLLRDACPAAAPEIDALVNRATSKNPDARYADMDAFLAALTEIPPDTEPRAVESAVTVPPTDVDVEAVTAPASSDHRSGLAERRRRQDRTAGTTDPDAFVQAHVTASLPGSPDITRRPRLRLLLGLSGAGAIATAAFATFLASTNPTAPRDSLSAKDLRAGFDIVHTTIRDCPGGTSSTTVFVDITIDTTGHVLQAKVRDPHRNTPLGDCVEKTAMNARFPPLTRPFQISYPFQL